MTATTATIPVFIFRADVSMTAKMIWLDRSLESSIKRPDVIIDVKGLAQRLKLSVSTIRRALRELIAAGLVIFKSWVCKTLKVFTLNWQKDARIEKADRKKDSVEKKEAPAQKPEVANPKESSVKSSESTFVQNEKGELFFQANEEHEVRKVAYKLVDIGFSQEGAIEIMCKKKLEGCKQLLGDLAYLEAQGRFIDDKVAWFTDMVSVK